MPTVIVLFIQNLISRSLSSFWPFAALAKQCQLYEAYENEYRTAHEIANFENARANNDDGDYYFRLPLYVQGERDASILISVNQNDNTKDVYEISEFQLRSNCVYCWFMKLSILRKSVIAIGGWGNTRTVINKNGIRLAEAIEYNILNEKKPVKIIVEMSTGEWNWMPFQRFHSNCEEEMILLSLFRRFQFENIHGSQQIQTIAERQRSQSDNKCQIHQLRWLLSGAQIFLRLQGY